MTPRYSGSSDNRDHRTYHRTLPMMRPMDMSTAILYMVPPILHMVTIQVVYKIVYMVHVYRVAMTAIYMMALITTPTRTSTDNPKRPMCPLNLWMIWHRCLLIGSPCQFSIAHGCMTLILSTVRYGLYCVKANIKMGIGSNMVDCFTKASHVCPYPWFQKSSWSTIGRTMPAS